MKKKTLVPRLDALATIGFDGGAALVDAQARREYASLGTEELLAKGFFRAATMSALYSGKPEELESVARAFNAIGGTSYPAEALQRLFGVAREEVSRVLPL